MSDMVVVPKLSWLLLHVLSVFGVGTWCFVGVFWMCFERQNPGATRKSLSSLLACVREEWAEAWGRRVGED